MPSDFSAFHVKSVQEIMLDYAGRDCCSNALHCWDGAKRAYFAVSYKELSQRAFAFGWTLAAGSLEQAQTIKGRVVMIACHSPYATLVAFYGAISAGAIPMIFPMPLSLGSHEALTERIKHWGFHFDVPALLVLETGLQEKFHDFIPEQIKVVRLSDSPEGEWERSVTPASSELPIGEDIAFFQTTSSSTGDHKAVAISHNNILANVFGIRRAQKMSDDERMTTWLPLFHDMGLVGTVLFSFCNDYPLFIMTPTQFVKRPAVWMRGMAENRCTIATAPNFGFDYCARLVSDKDAAELDLTKVKHLFIGAEPIRVSTVAGFLRKFKVSGISAQIIRPAYGLAESTIISTMTDPQETSKFICLESDSITFGATIQPLRELSFSVNMEQQYDPGRSMAICSAGVAIDGMRVEIVDEEGVVVAGDGVVGEIALQGSSVAMGYVAGGDSLISEFKDSYVRTGDLGAIVDGELYILERIKNIVIRNGENYLVSSLEEQLAELLGISHEHVAVFETDIHDPNSDIAVLVERHKGLNEQAIQRLLATMPKESFPINKIYVCRAREIPRTTSGKKRHFYCRKMLQSQAINHQQIIEVSPRRIMQAIHAFEDKS